METKYCSSCERDLPVTMFSKNRSRKDGLQSKCKECRKKSWKKEYTENVDYYKEKRRNQQQAGKDRFKKLKAESVCVVCGESEDCCLEFHHLDPSIKDTEVSRARYWSDGRYQSEVDKCICLCCNCHRKLHAGIISCPVSSVD